jgi:hypothetical protein
LTEGGFDSDDSKNASFNAEIGSAEDPGLRAEQQYSLDNASQAATAGMAGGAKAEGAGVYDALDAEKEA